ncbi:MAG: methionyl-tRNA formyltransferase [Spirochaetota bacterium]
MKIGFFGTPEIAAYYLNMLHGKHEIVFAVTGEDKPKGRHGTPVFNEVKNAAVENDIPVLQPAKLLDNDFLKSIGNLKADIFVVVAYGKLIPPEIFTMPSLKTVNVHPSLLPKYRGAAPIQWALINGESETGVTIQYINEKLDAGDILTQKRIPLNTDISADDLTKIVLPVGLELLLEALAQLQSGKAMPVKQIEAEATYCGKINKETARINWSTGAEKIHNLVRGLNPKPTAWTMFREKNIKIYKTKIAPDYKDAGLKQGYLKIIGKKLFVGTGNNILELLEVQPETKKVMNAASFINGYRLSDEDHFGS